MQTDTHKPTLCPYNSFPFILPSLSLICSSQQCLISESIWIVALLRLLACRRDAGVLHENTPLLKLQSETQEDQRLNGYSDWHVPIPLSRGTHVWVTHCLRSRHDGRLFGQRGDTRYCNNLQLEGLEWTTHAVKQKSSPATEVYCMFWTKQKLCCTNPPLSAS